MMTRMKRLARRLAAVTAAIAVMAAGPMAAYGSNVADAIKNAMSDKTPNYSSFTGTITEIREYHGDPSKKFVYVEDEAEAVINFIATADTYYAGTEGLEEGVTVTGYYDMLKPMAMIYPPQPEAVAFWVAGGDSLFAKVDRFDENMVSSDGILKLNLGQDTEVVRQDGGAFEPSGELKDELAGKPLMVFYDATTRSIPAQTTPSKIVILNDTSITWPEPETPVETPEPVVLPNEGTLVDLVVEGSVVGQTSFLTQDGIIMVPLYMVCSGLDVSLEWVPEAHSAVVADTYTAALGVDSYDVNGLTIALGAAPALIDDRTYVPLSFFTQVMGLNNAYFLEGQIVIDNGEKME